MLRSALIMPGLAIAGVRDKRLITGALLSSTLVSVFLVLFTVAERGRRGMSWKRHRRSNGLAPRKQRALAARRAAQAGFAGRGALVRTHVKVPARRRRRMHG